MKNPLLDLLEAMELIWPSGLITSARVHLTYTSRVTISVSFYVNDSIDITYRYNVPHGSTTNAAIAHDLFQDANYKGALVSPATLRLYIQYQGERLWTSQKQ